MRPPRTQFWLWPNKLSLDAPFIAVVWQDFLSRAYSIALSPAERVTLGLSVWVIYLADRFLDIRAADTVPDSPAHIFQDERRFLTRSLLSLAALADLFVAWEWLPRELLVDGSVLCLVVLAYLWFFSNYRLGSTWKTLSASALFTTGVFAAPWAQTPSSARHYALPFLAFVVLCFTNLQVLIRGRSVRSILWIGIFGLMAVVMVESASENWYLAISASALCLFAVSRLDGRVPLKAWRSLADLALLTPIIARHLPNFR